jgi:hypothetical protein
MALNLERLSAICPFYRCIAQKKNADLYGWHPSGSASNHILYTELICYMKVDSVLQSPGDEQG